MDWGQWAGTSLICCSAADNLQDLKESAGARYHGVLSEVRARGFVFVCLLALCVPAAYKAGLVMTFDFFSIQSPLF